MSDVFTGVTGTIFQSDQHMGTTLTKLSGNYIYTARDGTKVEFLGTPFDRQDIPCAGADANSCRVPLTITKPNGLKFTFTYGTANSTYKRLQRVDSSAGYRMDIAYATNNPGSGTPSDFWYQRTSVTFTNIASPPNPLPAIAYAYSDSGSQHEVDVTDPAGRTWILKTEFKSGHPENPVTLSSVESPAGGSKVSYSYGSDNTVDGAYRRGATTTYSRVVSGTTATVTSTDALNNATVAVVDLTLGRVTSITDPLNRTTNFEYDASGRLFRTILPEGNATRLGRDGRGNVETTILEPKSGSSLGNIKTSANFDDTCTNVVTCNKPNSTTDAKGNVTDYTYDPTHGGVLTVTQPTTGAVRPQTRYSYSRVTSASGDLVYMSTGISACQTTSSCTGTADETRTVTTYNSNLLPTIVSKGDGTGALTATTTNTYYPTGNLDTVDGPLPGTADTTKFRYDAVDQLVGTVGPDPDGAGILKYRATRITYRPDGQVSKKEVGTVNSQSDADWLLFAPLQTVDLLYDTSSRLERQKLSASGTLYAMTQYAYDADARPICTAVRMNPSAVTTQTACQLAPQGAFGPDRITTFAYDAAGQMTRKDVAQLTTDAAIESNLTYTDNGLLKTLRDANGNTTTFVYDGVDRLSKTRFPNPGGGGSSTTDYELLGYDANSNVTSRRLRDGNSILFGFDNLNRVKIKNLPGSEPDVIFAYDILGRLLTATQTGNAVGFTYDALGRKLTEAGPQGTVTSSYDLANRRTQITYPGTGLYVNYDYLLTGETTAVRENGATSGVGVLATYTYDNLGVRTGVTFGNGVVQAFGRDPVSRLSSLTNDLSGTIYDLSATFSYNPASQIVQTIRAGDTYAFTQIGNGSTAYTANGLNQTFTIGGVAATWDSKGNLTTEPQSGKTYGYSSENLLTSASGGVTLGYDPLKRLYQVAGAATTRIAYDGLNAIADYDGANGLFRRYVFANGVDDPIVWYEGSGTTDRRFMSADERGSIISLTDSAGALVGINHYDEYGKPQSTNLGAFQYTGQRWLSDLGAYYYKARVYLPRLGIFAQTDPAGYDPSPNLYAYVGKDPINANDPLGMIFNIPNEQPPRGAGGLGFYSLAVQVTTFGAEGQVTDVVYGYPDQGGLFALPLGNYSVIVKGGLSQSGDKATYCILCNDTRSMSSEEKNFYNANGIPTSVTNVVVLHNGVPLGPYIGGAIGFTMYNDVYLGFGIGPILNNPWRAGVLGEELYHVWQYQNGATGLAFGFYQQLYGHDASPLEIPAINFGRGI